MEIVEFGHMTAGQRDEPQGDEDDPFGAWPSGHLTVRGLPF